MGAHCHGSDGSWYGLQGEGGRRARRAAGHPLSGVFVYCTFESLFIGTHRHPPPLIFGIRSHHIRVTCICRCIASTGRELFVRREVSTNRKTKRFSCSVEATFKISFDCNLFGANGLSI